MLVAQVRPYLVEGVASPYTLSVRVRRGRRETPNPQVTAFTAIGLGTRYRRIRNAGEAKSGSGRTPF